jgi:hypothetical protein
LRCVEQSSSLASGGSKVPGAKLWRTTTTAPGVRIASHGDSVAGAGETNPPHTMAASAYGLALIAGAI